MLIVCPNCATSYQVEPSSLGAAGRSVRCVRCRKVWFAANTEAMAAISPAPTSEDLGGRWPIGGRPPAGRAAPARHPADQPMGHAARSPDVRCATTAGRRPLPEPREYDAAARAGDGRGRPGPGCRRGDPEAPPQAAGRGRPRGHRNGRRPPDPAAAAASAKSRWPVPGWATAILLLIAINIGPDRLARRHRAAVCRRPPRSMRRSACRSICAGSSSPRSSPARRPRTACRCWWSRASSRAPASSRQTCRGCASPCATPERPRDLQLDRAAGAQRARARRDDAVPLAARLAAARGARGAGALLQPARPGRRHAMR